MSTTLIDDYEPPAPAPVPGEQLFTVWDRAYWRYVTVSESAYRLMSFGKNARWHTPAQHQEYAARAVKQWGASAHAN